MKLSGITDLFTFKVKAALALGLIAGAIWYHVHAKTVAFEEGVAQGQVKLLGKQAEQLEEKTRAERATIAQERSELEAVRTAFDSEHAALSGQRRALAADIQRNSNQLIQRESQIRNETASIPDPDLLPAFRGSLAAVRAAERSRTAQ